MLQVCKIGARASLTFILLGLQVSMSSLFQAISNLKKFTAFFFTLKT